MPTSFLLYGAYGYVGQAIARMAVGRGLQPLLAGRDAKKLAALAAELGLEQRAFSLEDTPALESAMQDVPVVLHCAGPYIHTYRPVLQACLRTGTHYLDITGEIPVYQALADRDSEARQQGVMLLPGAGFDVVPTDCLALHLKQRLPGATHLALAFQSQGPARLPPGTANTAMELIQYPTQIRRDGQLVPARRAGRSRQVDFGDGPVTATRLNWGDIFTAYYSTGIPNIENYSALPVNMARLLNWVAQIRPVFKLAAVRKLVRRFMPTGATPEERARSRTRVWGEVRDAAGSKAVARLHGPEAGVEWTALTALAVVQRVLAGDASPGFQTPARVYGADFILECGSSRREDIEP